MTRDGPDGPPARVGRRRRFPQRRPVAPDATPREPVAEPVAGDDADPATRGVPDEEPEEEPDYEPDDEPTPPPKRPREEEEDADAPETDADAKRPRTTNDDERDRDGDDDDDGAKSPQAKSPTRALRIDNFVRPFTFNQVRALLRQFGAFASDGEDIDGEEDGAGLGLGLAAGGEAVWMNQPVKTHAIGLRVERIGAVVRQGAGRRAMAGGDGAATGGVARERGRGEGDRAGRGAREAGAHGAGRRV